MTKTDDVIFRIPSHALTATQNKTSHSPRRQELDPQRAFLSYFDSFDVGRIQQRQSEQNHNVAVSRFPNSRTANVQSHERIVPAMPVAVTTSETSQVFGTWLQEALQQLEESCECAADEELHPPSTIAIQKTGMLLREISECVESAPDIYPMHKSSLAIDFRTPDGKSGVLFVIEQDGSGTLFYPTRDSDGWTSFEDAMNLFAGRGADELKRAGIR